MLSGVNLTRILGEAGVDPENLVRGDEYGVERGYPSSQGARLPRRRKTVILTRYGVFCKLNKRIGFTSTVTGC